MNAPRSGTVGVGVVGAGVISEQYLATLTAAPDLRVVIVSDLDGERAANQARRFGVLQTGSIADVVAHPDVEIVVNLTNPSAHVEVGLRAVQSGRHLWSEKPLAVSRPGGRLLIDESARHGVLIASAPDTLLGDGFQTARRLIDAGAIGTPLTATTAFRGVGPEIWHPHPAFLYSPGGGPLMDMGPYFVAGLVNVFGSIASVAATSVTSRKVRRIATGPNAGEEFTVRVPTHIAALIRFEGGGTAESVFSFESPVARGSLFEITGTDGILHVPDPNAFGGTVRVTRPDGTVDVHPTLGEGARGIGVVDLARAIRSGDPVRASGQLAYHVLDALVAIAESARSGKFRRVSSSALVPELLPVGWDPRTRTL